MGQGFHNVHKGRHKEPQKRALDKLMYGIGLIAPVMTIPQLLQIWQNHKTQGVSITTWAAYAFVAALWLVYGLIHKEKPIILTNVLLVIVDIGIVVGILLLK